jgi:hypothetical protein
MLADHPLLLKTFLPFKIRHKIGRKGSESRVALLKTAAIGQIWAFRNKVIRYGVPTSCFCYQGEGYVSAVIDCTAFPHAHGARFIVV